MQVLTLTVGFASLLVTISCGGSAASACELAHEKLQECKVEILRSDSIGASLLPLVLDMSPDCSATNRCVAECVMPASCGAISYVIRGSTDPNEPPPAGAGTFQGCLYSCL
jgi:hypothetical protein